MLPLPRNGSLQKRRGDRATGMTGVQIEQHIASQPAAISDAVVRILSEHTGRGPTGVRTTIRDGLVLVVLRDTMTKGEHSLLAAGHRDFVTQERALHQTDMHDDLIAAVRDITGRAVEALMSASHVDPDMAVEIFVLEST